MKKHTSRILAVVMVLAMLVGMIPAVFASSNKVLFEAQQANTNGVNPDVVTGSQFEIETTLNITSISDIGMKFVLGNNASGHPVEVWLGEYAIITVNSAWVSNQWLGVSNITNRDLPVRLVVNGSKISLFLDNKLTLEATDSTYEVVSDSKVQLTQWSASYTIKDLTIRTLDTSVLYKLSAPATNGVQPGATTGASYVATGVINISDISAEDNRHVKFELGTSAADADKKVELYITRGTIFATSPDWKGYGMYPFNYENYLNRDVQFKLIVDGTYVALYLDGEVVWAMKDASFQLAADSKLAMSQWDASYTLKSLTVSVLEDATYGETIYEYDATNAPAMTQGAGTRFVAEATVNISSVSDAGARGIKFVLGNNTSGNNVELWIGKDNIWANTHEWKGYNRYPFSIDPYLNQDTVFTLVVDGTYYVLYANGEIIWEMRDSSFLLAGNGTVSVADWDAPHTLKSLTVKTMKDDVIFESTAQAANGFSPNVNTGAYFMIDTTLNISAMSDVGMKFELGTVAGGASGQRVELWLSQPQSAVRLTSNNEWIANVSFDWTSYMGQDIDVKVKVEGKTITAYFNGVEVISATDDRLLIDEASNCVIGAWSATYDIKGVTITKLEAPAPDPGPGGEGGEGGEGGGEESDPTFVKGGSLLWDAENADTSNMLSATINGSDAPVFSSRPVDLVVKGVAGKGFNGTKALGYHMNAMPTDKDADNKNYADQNITIHWERAGFAGSPAYDWTGKEMLWFWVDTSEFTSAQSIRVQLEGKSGNGAKYYFWDGENQPVLGGTVATGNPTWGRMPLTTGYKGFIGIELDAFVSEGLTLGAIWGVQFYYEPWGECSASDVKTLYIDELWLTAKYEMPNVTVQEPAPGPGGEEPGPGGEGGEEPGPGEGGGEEPDPNLLYELAAPTTGGVEPNVVTGPFYSVEAVINASNFTYNFANVKFHVGYNAAGAEIRFELNEDSVYANVVVGDDQTMLAQDNVNFGLGSNLNQDVKVKLVVEGDKWTFFVNDTQTWTLTDERLIATDTSMFKFSAWEVGYNLKSLKVVKLEAPGPGGEGGEEPGPGGEGGGEEADPNLLYELAAPTTGNVEPNVVTGAYYSVEAVINASNFTYNYANVKFHVGYNADGKELRFELNEDSVYANLCTPKPDGSEDQAMLNQDNQTFGLGKNLNQDVKVKLVVEGSKWTFFVNDTQTWTIDDNRLVPTDDSVFKFSAWEVTYELDSLKIMKLEAPAPGPGGEGGEEPGPGGEGGEEPGPGGEGGEEPGPGTGGEDAPAFDKGGLLLWNAEAADLNNILSATPNDGGEVNSSSFPANLIAKGVDGKGYNGSRALAYGMKAMPGDQYWGNHLRLHWKGAGMSYDWTGSEMLWFWVDTSEFTSAQSIRVQLEGKKGNGAKYYFWDGENELVPGGTIADGDPNWGRMPLSTGYVGWIGIELDAYIAAGLDLAKVWNVEFYFEPWNEASETNTKLLYIDELWLTDKNQVPSLVADEEEDNTDSDVLYELKVPVNNMLNPNVVTGNKFVAEMTLNISSMSDLGVKIILGENIDGKQNELWLSGTKNDIFISNPDWKGSGLDETKFDFASLKGKDINVKITVDGETVKVEIDGKLAWKWQDPSFRLSTGAVFKMDQWTANYTIKSLKLSRLAAQGSVVNPSTGDGFAAWLPAVVALVGVAGAAFVISQKKRFF